MKPSPNSSRRSGSVLMETVIVLPLLLLLFGGLFVLGDLAHGRLHLLAVDRAAAWSSANRFAEPTFRSWFAFVPRTSALRIERIRSADIADAMRTDLASTTNATPDVRAKLRGTAWTGFYGGWTHAAARVPTWAATANAHNSLFGGAEADRLPPVRRYFIHSVDDDAGNKAGDWRDDPRAYVIHRRPVVDEVFSRTARASDLRWTAVVGDPWPGTGASTGLSASSPGVAFRRHPYVLLVGE